LHIDADRAVHNRHRKLPVEHLVITTLRDYIEIAQDRVSADRHVEDPLAHNPIPNFRKTQRDIVLSVGNRDGITKPSVVANPRCSKE
jgi:hypothetical protein